MRMSLVLVGVLSIGALSLARADTATGAPNRVEVIEFFSYGCPHCFHLHPQLMAWVATLPADVEFKRIPQSLGRPQWLVYSRAYYALEASGLLARADNALFDAVQVQKRAFYDVTSLAAWLRSAGFDEADVQRFRTAYDSDQAVNQVAQSERMASQYRIDSVPTLLIDRKQRAVGLGSDAMIAYANQLIALARSERKAASTGRN